MERNIRVCVINPNFYRSSGVTTSIKRIYKGSELLPIDWYFLSCDYKTDVNLEDSDWIIAGKLSTLNLMQTSPLAVVKESYKLSKYLRANKIDIVHVHHRRLALIVGIITKFLRIPLVYTAQITYKKNIIFRYAPMSAVVAISNSVLKNIRETINVKNCVPISNPSFFEVIIPKFSEGALKKVACIARLDPVKNHLSLLKAWSLIDPHNNGYKLVLVGEGSQLTSLKELAKDLNINSSVEFVGYSSAVSDIIKEALFLVLPSWREGHPLVVVEGAGLGRATLLSDVDGSRDCVPPNVFLKNKINPSSADELAMALKQWFESPERAMYEGILFYKFWVDKASAQVVAEKYFNLYRDLRK